MENVHKCKCGICFNTLSINNLKYHIKVVHEGVRKYKCETCGKTCGQASDLKRHINSSHKHLNVETPEMITSDTPENPSIITSDTSEDPTIITGDTPEKPPMITSDTTEKPSEPVTPKWLESGLFKFFFTFLSNAKNIFS